MSFVPTVGRRLRIAVLSRSFDVTGGGAERYSIAVVEQLAQKHEVHVFAQTIKHHLPAVHYHRLWTPLAKPRWINQLWFAARSWWATRRGFDVVDSHENTWHGQVQTVHVLPIKFTLLQGRSGWSRGLRWLKIATSLRLLAYLWLEKRRFAYSTSRRIVVTSPSLGTLMRETYPAVIPLLRVIPPGVSEVPGPPKPMERAEARARLGLPAEGFGVLFVANDFRRKGFPTMIEALSQLPGTMYLIVVGPAEQASVYRKQLASKGLEKRVFFVGTQRDMHDVYVAADCLAHPTLEDTFAMVVLEAMSHGLPVVVSSVTYCGIAGLLQDRLQALLLEDPRNPGTLAHAIKDFAESPTLVESLTQAGVAFAKQHLWSEVGVQHEKVFHELLNPVPILHRK
jgi:glycosyltransferase involved in cell wall biosynthesis